MNTNHLSSARVGSISSPLGRMPRTLAFLLAITDVTFLLYWSMTSLAELSVIHVPSEWMYADYNQPQIVAWNWSFFPLDVVLSIVGLSAVAASNRSSSLWRPLAVISLTLTSVAGGMAISYWVLLRQFDPSWFLPNLALCIWPLIFLPGLVKGLSRMPQ